MRWLLCCLLIGWCTSSDVFPDVIREAAFDKIITNYYLNDPFSRQGRDYGNPTAPYRSSEPSKRPQYSTRYSSNEKRREKRPNVSQKPSYSAPSYQKPRPSYSEPAYKKPRPSYSEPAYKKTRPSYSEPAYKKPRPSYSEPAYEKPRPSYTEPDQLELDYLPPLRVSDRKPKPSYSEPEQLELDYLPPPGAADEKSAPSYSEPEQLELDYLPPSRVSERRSKPSFSSSEHLPPRRRPSSSRSQHYRKPEPSYSDLETDYLPPPRRPSYSAPDSSSAYKRKRNTYARRDPWSPDFCSFFHDGPSGVRVKRRRPKSVYGVDNEYRGQMRHPSDWPDLFYGDLGRHGRSRRRAG